MYIYYANANLYFHIQDLAIVIILLVLHSLNVFNITVHASLLDNRF